MERRADGSSTLSRPSGLPSPSPNGAGDMNKQDRGVGKPPPRSPHAISKALTRFRIPWRWNGGPALLQSRATDETGCAQPTREKMLAARGNRAIYHSNAITTWAVSDKGEVKHVYAYWGHCSPPSQDTSREDHRSPRSGREVQHRRWGAARFRPSRGSTSAITRRPDATTLRLSCGPIVMPPATVDVEAARGVKQKRRMSFASPIPFVFLTQSATA
jgi:hypothetical protein